MFVQSIMLVQNTGKITINFAQKIGQITLLILNALFNLKPFYFKNFYKQLLFIGFYSLPVVSMTALFSGAVLALQTYSGFSRFAAEHSIPTVVVLSITRELGPVLAALMVTSRVGASIAAEIATMRVTEQIDALFTLSTNPAKYLITPRIFAGMISMPCLVLVGDVLGVMGGYLVSIYKLGFNSNSYLISTFKYLEPDDVISGLVKALVFGLIITSASCFCGYNAGKGARGVGKATTSAVVLSSVLILSANYIVTEFFVK